jgi:hypothetical protein
MEQEALMALVQCGSDTIINARDVSSIEWDRGHSYTAMVVTMLNGRTIRFKHQPNALGGLDCHRIEAELLLASQVAFAV